jgi:plasmid stabilization system protein ParE
MKLIWSERAQADVLEIARYIGTDNRSAAAAWVKKITDRAQLACEFPQAGRVVPEYSKEDLIIVTVFERHRRFPE